MKKLIIFAAVAVGLASQSGAQAPQAAPQGSHGGGKWMHRDITRQQAQQMADMMFGQLDLNHDGALTRQEVEQARAQMGGGDSDRGGGRAERMISQLFGDAQSVTLTQAEAQALAHFDAMDLNHDGVVTVDERQQARMSRGGQR